MGKISYSFLKKSSIFIDRNFATNTQKNITFSFPQNQTQP